MLTAAEQTAVEQLRKSEAGMGRAIVALLLDRDGERARAELCTQEERSRRYFERALPPVPGRFGFSPCDGAILAACDVLCHAPVDRRLKPLALVFDPAVTNADWSGCPPSAVDPALALVAWIMDDMSRCGRHLIRSRPEGIVDRVLTEVTSLLFRNRGSDVGGALARLGPEYAAAMADGLWRSDPYAFVHVSVLAALEIGVERGLLDLSQLADTVPYVPLWFLRRDG